MTYLDSLNLWIMDHQALVIAVGIPLLTAISAGMVSYFTNRSTLRSQATDRELQKVLKTFDSHQDRIAQFKKAAHAFERISFQTKFDLINGINSGKPNHLTAEATRLFVEQHISARIELLLLVDPLDPDAKVLVEAMDFNPFSVEKSATNEVLRESNTIFFPICRRMIVRMEANALDLLKK